jgi:hypothetical protein
MDRMTTALDAANASYYDDWEPSDLYAQGGEPPTGEYFDDQGTRGADISVEPEQDSPAPQQQLSAKVPMPREQRAVGGVSMAHVQGAEQLQLTPVVDASAHSVPVVTLIANSGVAPATDAPGVPAVTAGGTDGDVTAMTTDSHESKRAREATVDEAEDEQAEGKKKAPIDEDDLNLWDCTPKLTQDEADEEGTLSQLSAEMAIEAEHIQLRPGYTAYVCAQYILAWNSMCRAPAQVDNGHNAAMLLRNGLQAEKRLHVIIHAKTAKETQGYQPSDALKVLAKAHRALSEERSKRDDADCVKTFSETSRQPPASSN